MAWLIIGILAFMLLVIIHELWHFIAAKKSGVNVEEFWIGIPPRVTTLGKDKSGTNYTLNWIPLWWFVRLKWEDPKEAEYFNAKDSFIKASLRNKIIILLSWVGMNFLLAYIIFVVIFTVGVKPISIIPENAVAIQSRSYLMPTVDFLVEKNLLSWSAIEEPAVIQEVEKDSLAFTLWIQSWDILTYINTWALSSWNIWTLLKEQLWKTFDLHYTRSGKSYVKTVSCPESECLLGANFYLDIKEIKFPFPKAMGVALGEIRSEIKLTLHILWNFGRALFSFNGEKIGTVVNKLTGPAWAIKFGDLLLEYRWRLAYLSFVGLLSLSLAIFNILPIPALDWWRLLGVLIQSIFRLKAEKYFTIEWYLNLFFFVLLMWLGVYILVKDLIMFWWLKLRFLG